MRTPTDPAVSEQVRRRILVERDSGRSYAEIAADLTASRYLTTAGRPFTAAMVRRIYSAASGEQVAS